MDNTSGYTRPPSRASSGSTQRPPASPVTKKSSSSPPSSLTHSPSTRPSSSGEAKSSSPSPPPLPLPFAETTVSSFSEIKTINHYNLTGLTSLILARLAQQNTQRQSEGSITAAPSLNQTPGLSEHHTLTPSPPASNIDSTTPRRQSPQQSGSQTLQAPNATNSPHTQTFVQEYFRYDEDGEPQPWKRRIILVG